MSPDRGTYHCFGCGVGGDAISFVEEIEGVDFVGAIEWLADRFNVPLEYEDSSPAADAQRRKRDRLHALLEQAAAFYERYLWESAAGEPVRAYLARTRAGGADLQGVPPRSLAGRELARAQGAREGIHAGGAQGGRARRRAAATTSRRRLMFPLTDARGRIDRLPGAQAARGRSAARQVRELARRRALPQVRDPLRAAPRARRDGEAGPRARRRGEHRRDRAAAGRARAGRRVDGNRADRAAAERARAADAARLPLLRLRRCGRGGDTARDGARAAARLRGEGRLAAERKGSRRRSRRDSRRASPTRSRMRCIACASSSTARATGSTRTCACRTCSTPCPSRPSGTRRGGSRTTGSA